MEINRKKHDMQGLENTGGLTEYGSYIALALVVVWAVLLIPLCRAKLKTRSFIAASVPFAFLIVFFWLWPTITEISILQYGSIKTNVEQARTYLTQMKEIQSEVEDIRKKIAQDASQLQAETAKMRADFDRAQAGRQTQSVYLEVARLNAFGTHFVSAATSSQSTQVGMIS